MTYPPTPTCHRHPTPEPFRMLPRVPPIPAPATHKPAPQLPIYLAALLAQIQQLMAMVQALQHQNQLLQDQIDTHPLVPVAPTPTPVTVPEVKIAMSNSYNGSLEKTEHFLHQCKVYFLGLPGQTAHQHVTFAISYMNKGCALFWAEQMVEEITWPDHIADWAVFKNSVRNSFSNSDHIVMGHLKIKEVKQGRESVDDYVVWFKKFEGFTGFDDTTLTEIFKEGLSP
jgi:hypothetical protein